MIESENSVLNNKINHENSKVKVQKAKNPKLKMKKMRQPNKQDQIYQLDVVYDKNCNHKEIVLETAPDYKGKVLGLPF